MLVQIILALGFFHLAFNAAADAFFYLHDVQFGFQLGKQKLHTADNAEGFQNLLALLQFQLQMRRNRIHQTAVIIDAIDGINDFGRDFFIQLGVLVKLGKQRATNRFDIGIVRIRILIDSFDMGQEQSAALFNGQYSAASDTFDQHFHRAVRQLQHLQNLRDRTRTVQIGCSRIFGVRVDLRQQKHRIVICHCRFQCRNGFRAAYKQRQHHVRINDDIS